MTPLPTANDSAKITLLEILERAIFAPEYLKRKIIASVNFALGITRFKIINGFFLSSLAICKKGRVATLPFLQIAREERKKPLIILNRVMPRAKLTDAMILRLRYSGAKIARSRISSKVIFAESFAVGRGVIDINVTSDAAKEIINVGNEILRNL